MNKYKKAGLVCVLLLNFFFSLAHSDNAQPYWKQYETAKELVNKKNYQEALNILNPLLSQQENFNLYLLIGQAYSGQDRPDLAFTYFQKAYDLAKKSNNPEYLKTALFNLGRVELALRNGQAAQLNYEVLLTLKLSSEDRKLAEENLEQSKKLFEKQNITKQIDDARNYIAQGNGQKAFETIKPLLSNNQAIVYIVAGDSYSIQDNPSEALNYYKQAYQFAKLENNETLQRVSLFAIARMQVALRDAKGMNQSFQQLSSMNLSQEDREKVNEGLKGKTIEIFPQARIVEIQAYIEKENGQKALKLLNTFSDQDKTAIYYLLVGHAKGLVKEPQEALDNYTIAYKMAIKENKENIQRLALFSMGRMQLALRQPGEAEQTYRNVLKMNLTAEEKNTALQQLNRSIDMKKQKQIAGVQPQNKDEPTLRSIYAYLDKGEGMNAYQLTIKLIKEKRIAKYYLLAAKSMVAADRPHYALDLYRTSYRLALMEKNIDLQRESLEGISTVQMWLDQYVRATETYIELLRYPLNAKQYELAKAGQVKSLAYRGSVYAAEDVLPKKMIYTSPQMVIPALQVALWSKQTDVAKCLYRKYKTVLQEIKPKTYLARDLKNIEWQLPLDGAAYQISPEYYTSHDTDGFNIHRSILNSRRYWSQTWQTYFGLSNLNYSQHHEKYIGNSFYVGQAWNPSRHFNASARVSPTHFADNWNPVLWSVEASFIPNDFVTVIGTVSNELLEAFSALENHNRFINYNLTAIFQPLPYVILSGTKYRLYFNDDNTRDGHVLIGKLLIIPEQGIYVGYRARNYTSGFRSPFYFSPDQYYEGTYLGGISHRLGDTWRYFAEGAMGQQTIKPNPSAEAGSSQTWFYRFGIRGPITRCIFLDLRYGTYNQASAFSESTGYRYSDFSAVLNFSFDA